MSISLNFPVAIAFGAAVVLALTGAASADVAGLWLTEDGKARVKIEQCGEQLCGAIVWLKEPLDDEGKEKVDKNNPDLALRDRPLIGLQILSGFARTGPGQWEDGRIYSPSEGDLYKAKMAEDGVDRLKLRGYVGIPLLGKTQVWTRVEE